MLNTNQNTNALAIRGGIDPFTIYANAVTPRTIIGTLIKFSKGEYLAGKDGVVIPIGTRFTACVDELMAGWARWSDGKPAEHLMVRIADGVPPLKREDLGHTDRSLWDLDDRGQPKDPWQFINYLLLMDDEGRLYTYTTASRGGLSAIAGLCRTYVSTRRKYPDDHLVISLGVDSYQHTNRDYGRIKFPVFEVASHEPKAGFTQALAEVGATTGEPAAPDEPEQPDMPIDEIPF
jgi:hypothetical protein